MAGPLDQLVVESDVLAGNPLGDPDASSAVRLPAAGHRARRPGRRAVGVRDPGLQRPGGHLARPHASSSRRSSSGSTRCSPPASARRRSSCSSTSGRRSAARSSSTRPGPAATWTTCATRSCRSSTSAIPTLAGRAIAGWPASPRAATARWWCRCCDQTCSAAFASHAGDALFEAAISPRFPASPDGLRDDFERVIRGSAPPASRRPPRSTGVDSARRSRCMPTPAPIRLTGPGRARRCSPSTSPPAA